MSARHRGPWRRFLRWMDGRDTPDSILWPFIFATIGLFITLNVVNVGLLGIYPIPDLLHPASAASLQEALAQMDPTSRQNYLRTAFLDVIYPLSYGIAFSGALTRMRPHNTRTRWIPWVPVCGCLLDLTENLFFALLVGEVVPPTGLWLVPAAAANTLKWICADFTMIAVATLLLWRGGQWYHAWRRRTAPQGSEQGSEG